MATYIVSRPDGLGPGGFFASLSSSPPVTVTQGAGTTTTLRYNFSDGRYVLVTGTGFTYNGPGGTPDGGLITSVQLFSL
jgi:hypothetical protein